MTYVKQLELAIAMGPTVVTVLFLAIFAGTVIWIYRPGSKGHYDRQAQLPLEDSAPGATTNSAPEKRHG